MAEAVAGGDVQAIHPTRHARTGDLNERRAGKAGLRPAVDNDWAGDLRQRREERDGVDARTGEVEQHEIFASRHHNMCVIDLNCTRESGTNDDSRWPADADSRSRVLSRDSENTLRY